MAIAAAIGDFLALNFVIPGLTAERHPESSYTV